jgi:PAS domain S-box-containing protein
MRLPNLNKAFSFLSIRSKLTVGFVGLSVLVLVLVGGYGFLWSTRALREAAIDRTEQQVATIRAATGEYFRSIAADLQFLATTAGSGPLANDSSEPGLNELLSGFLEKRPEFYQLLLLGDHGEELARVERTPDGVVAAPESRLRRFGGRFYVERLKADGGAGLLIFPSELRGRDESDPVPAMSVALNVPEQATHTLDFPLAIIVGHLYARDFFRLLEQLVPAPDGVVAVANREGRYLYHSERKTEWNRLLAERDTDTVYADFDSSTASLSLGGGIGTILSREKDLVSYGPLVGGPGAADYVVLRALPREVVFTSARSLTRIFLLLAVISTLVALTAGAAAAEQFTRPIRRLQRFAGRVAAGATPGELPVSTNDEIEILANDLERMARALERRDEQIREYADELEQRAQRNEEYLSSVLQSSADAILSLDTGGLVQSWNEGARRIFGYTAEEIVDKPISILVPPERLASRELEQLHERVMETGVARNVATKRLHKDGRVLSVNLTRTLLRDEKGRIVGSSSVVKDITEQQELERKVAESEKLAAMGRLAGGLAHQIGTPLGVMKATAELIMREGGAESAIGKDAATIRRQIEQISQLVESLLALGRRRPTRLESLDAAALVNDAIKLSRERRVEPGIKIATELSTDLPPVRSDRNLILEALLNLLDNAIQVMNGEGSLTVAARAAVGAPTGGRRAEGVEIDVRDTGPGIPPEDLPHIFEPFFTTREVGKGTGLGLALSRQFIEHQGGALVVSSPPEGGAVFTIWIPVYREAAP